MANYEKPVVILNEELAEGIYAASGDNDCWTATARIHQRPETGRGDYRLQVDAYHVNPDMHNSSATITIVFNQPVIVTNPGWGIQDSGSGTATIKLTFDIGTSNPNEHKGWGDLVVTGDPGLEVLSVSIHCNGI